MATPPFPCFGQPDFLCLDASAAQAGMLQLFLTILNFCCSPLRRLLIYVKEAPEHDGARSRGSTTHARVG